MVVQLSIFATLTVFAATALSHTNVGGVGMAIIGLPRAEQGVAGGLIAAQLLVFMLPWDRAKPMLGVCIHIDSHKTAALRLNNAINLWITMDHMIS